MANINPINYPHVIPDNDNYGKVFDGYNPELFPGYAENEVCFAEKLYREEIEKISRHISTLGKEKALHQEKIDNTEKQWNEGYFLREAKKQIDDRKAKLMNDAKKGIFFEFDTFLDKLEHNPPIDDEFCNTVREIDKKAKEANKAARDAEIKAKEARIHEEVVRKCEYEHNHKHPPITNKNKLPYISNPSIPTYPKNSADLSNTIFDRSEIIMASENMYAVFSDDKVYFSHNLIRKFTDVRDSYASKFAFNNMNAMREYFLAEDKMWLHNGSAEGRDRKFSNVIYSNTIAKFTKYTDGKPTIYFGRLDDTNGAKLIISIGNMEPSSGKPFHLNYDNDLDVEYCNSQNLSYMLGMPALKGVYTVDYVEGTNVFITTPIELDADDPIRTYFKI